MRKKKMKVMIPIAAIAIGLLTGCGASETNEASGYEIEEVLLDDCDTGVLTDIDKQAKYMDYLEGIFEDDIAEAYPSVKSAEVTLSETEGAMQAVISLDLQEELEGDSVSKIAEAIAKAMDGASTDNVIIQDAEGNILF